ncbi:MAG: sugar kinase [Planctomycetota bacterium]|nr:sugar kinase [Planctomycetota bacterium]
MFDRIVLITKLTPLEELIERFNSRAQAKFYIEHSGASFTEYEQAHDAYHASADRIRKLLPQDVKMHCIERSFVPNYLFGGNDLVATLGPDGLVINVAKYLNNQPILAVNPDTKRVDGIMVPFSVETAHAEINRILEGDFTVDEITMAKATLNDGQELYGVNDLFIGPRSHISLRCTVHFDGKSEDQCSSGIIVTTGAGSTAWFRAIIAGARGVVKAFDNIPAFAERPHRFDWGADHLYFSVREPFESSTSHANIVFGRITPDRPLEVVSQMPQNGVIFSDGIEKDFLEFNSGRTAAIAVAEKKARLIRNE